MRSIELGLFAVPICISILYLSKNSLNKALLKSVPGSVQIFSGNP